MVDFVAPAGRVEDHKLRSEWGLSRPRPCLISREGYQMVKDVLTTADVPCTSGILHPSIYSNADGLLRMLERMDKDFGYQLEFLETDTVKDLLDTPKYYQAWRDPKGFHFDALALCLLLGEDVRKQGVPIYEETLMKQFHQISSGWGVTRLSNQLCVASSWSSAVEATQEKNLPSCEPSFCQSRPTS